MNFVKKHHILLTCIVLLIVAVLGIEAFIAWVDAPLIIPNRSIESHAKSELIDLYWENKENLNITARSILGSEAFLTKLKENDEDEYIKFKSDSKYFTENDWEAIVDVFETFRPYAITRSLRGGYDVVYIDFDHRREDGTYKHNGLFYFEDPEAVERYERYLWVGKMEHIDGCWYVDEWRADGSNESKG